jgi:L-asparaginase
VSGDWGFLGVVDFDRIVYSRAPLRRQHLPINKDPMPYVEIISTYGGTDGYMLKAAVEHGAKGIVVQALGWGNVNPATSAAIKETIGRVLPNSGNDGGGKVLADAGAVMGDDLSPQKARILLMLLLQNGVKGQPQLQAAFSH